MLTLKCKYEIYMCITALEIISLKGTCNFTSKVVPGCNIYYTPARWYHLNAQRARPKLRFNFATAVRAVSLSCAVMSSSSRPVCYHVWPSQRQQLCRFITQRPKSLSNLVNYIFEFNYTYSTNSASS